MLSDEIMSRIFADEEMQKLPLNVQSIAVHTVKDVLREAYYELDDRESFISFVFSNELGGNE